MLNKHSKQIVIFTVLFLFSFGVGRISAAGLPFPAGNLDSPAPPGTTSSFNLEDIYKRLDTGEPGTQKTFKEPTNGATSGTMHTLNQVMGKAPSKDNANGATSAHVVNGKKFWGIGTQWGPSIGTRPPVPLPRTGQTTSYESDDDGDLRKGVVWPSPRFSDNGNGTVTDHLTNLVWLKNINCFGEQSWDENLSDANNLASGLCDLSDGSQAGQWRMPNVREMSSLYDLGQEDPCLPIGHPFTSTIELAQVYWMSTVSDIDTADDRWSVNLWNCGNDAIPKTEEYYLWPVRDP